MEHVPVPDAQERLRRAFELILRAAARAEQRAGKENAHAQDSQQGGLRDGG